MNVRVVKRGHRHNRPVLSPMNVLCLGLKFHSPNIGQRFGCSPKSAVPEYTHCGIHSDFADISEALIGQVSNNPC